MVAFTLVIVGGINWGLVGLMGFDLVAWLFGGVLGMEMLARLVYILVGVAAVYEVLIHKQVCTHCGVSGKASASSAPAAGGAGMGTM